MLASGGLDSCVLLACVAELASEVYPLFVRNGHPWEDAEVAALRRFVEALGRRISAPSLNARCRCAICSMSTGAHAATGRVFPKATAPILSPAEISALLSVASLFAFVHGVEALALGLLEGNPYPDASPRFFSAFEKVYAEGMGRPLRILTPFAQLPKEEIVRIGEALPLELSLSCVNPVDGQHCGNSCNKCAERQKAFALAGIADRTQYRNTPAQVDWKTHQWPD